MGFIQAEDEFYILYEYAINSSPTRILNFGNTYASYSAHVHFNGMTRANARLKLTNEEQ